MKTSKNKNNHIITPKNLENIIKLFLKSNDKKRSKRRRRKNINNRLVHQQHRNEPQGNILTNYLLNQKKETDYKKESGLFNDDVLLIKYFENNLSDIKKAIDGKKSIDSTKLLTYHKPSEEKKATAERLVKIWIHHLDNETYFGKAY